MTFFEYALSLSIGFLLGSLVWATIWRARSDKMRREITDELRCMRSESYRNFEALHRSIVSLHDVIQTWKVKP